jgi:hypothetical protein
VGTSSNCACAMCPIVTTGKACLSLLGHHSSNGITATGRLSIATEGYRPLVQRRIIVLRDKYVRGDKILNPLMSVPSYKFYDSACKTFYNIYPHSSIMFFFVK